MSHAERGEDERGGGDKARLSKKKRLDVVSGGEASGTYAFVATNA